MKSGNEEANGLQEEVEEEEAHLRLPLFIAFELVIIKSGELLAKWTEIKQRSYLSFVFLAYFVPLFICHLQHLLMKVA